MQPPVALTIAGSDSGGGAGLQADLRTFAAHGVHGTVAITAVTAQSTTSVDRVLALDPDMVVAQIESVLGDLAPAATKTGMLATAATVAAIGILAAEGRLPNLVVDPVLVSTSGQALVDEAGVGAYRTALIPYARVVTPNLREAAVLTGRDFSAMSDVDAMILAGTEICALGPELVVIKGGHLNRSGQADAQSPDVVVTAAGHRILAAPRVLTANDHGTGCSLSAAIAANLALGADGDGAIDQAKSFVHAALASAADWHLGAGHGPIDHFGWNRSERSKR